MGTVPATHLSSRTAQVTQRTREKSRAGHVREVERKSSHGPAPYILGTIIAVAVLAFLAVRVLPTVLNKINSTGSTTTVEEGTEVTVTIPKGASGQTIFKALVEAGLLDNSQSSDFLNAYKSHGDNAQMQAGTYTIVAGTSVSDIVDDLIAGPSSSYAYKLTVPEGYTVAKTAAAVAEAIPSISADDFLAQAKASNYVADYPFLSSAADDSLEGYLFPKTYTFNADVDADTVIRTMLTQYQTEMAALDFSTAEAAIQSRYGVTMSDYDVMIMASIIEREAVTDDQRANISSVFYNRLQAGMPLQSDATMGYVTGGEVTADNLKQESPYNTYLNEGLPPTPICAPSIASIQAALAPADTNYLYFYIVQENGQTVSSFSETYDEHLASIAASSNAETGE
ncbi:MAG: endolytic transglycosylase MltG [Atopobiaceae bacterium]